jgi:DNA-binding NtrC family response regulator
VHDGIAISLTRRQTATQRQAARVASTDCPLLITGETGAGKGHLARWIHDHSHRAGDSFVPVNCGAIPESLADSHLFGHRKGAFSDAVSDHSGLVRSAEDGTLFLDEVSDLSPSAQIRLLRLLDEGEAQAVGAAFPDTVDVRIIAATNRDLGALVGAGCFREDLFYRLNVITFHVRALRERTDEIGELVETFNEELGEQIGRGPLAFDPAVIAALERHSWPGNVRQLRTVLERLHVLCPHDRVHLPNLWRFGQIQIESAAADPPPTPTTASRPAVRRLARSTAAPLPRVRSRFMDSVQATIDACDGNISRAAAALGVHRSTVHRWLAREHAA